MGWRTAIGKRARGLKRRGRGLGPSPGDGRACRPLALTLVLIDALDQGGGQGLVTDLAGIETMAFVLGPGQRQGAAEAVCAVLAVLLSETLLDVAGLDNSIHFPTDFDSFGVKAIH